MGGGGFTVSTLAAEQCWEAMAEQGPSPLPGAGGAGAEACMADV